MVVDKWLLKAFLLEQLRQSIAYIRTCVSLFISFVINFSSFVTLSSRSYVCQLYRTRNAAWDWHILV